MSNNPERKHLFWKSEYNIGNLKIDTEHQQLFALARKALSVNNLNNKEDGKEKLKEIINKLFTYVKIHFRNEEEYMKEINYLDIKRHKNLHQYMLGMLKELLSELGRMQIHEIENVLYDFINEYFVKHIIIEDKKIHLSQISLEDLRRDFGWRDVYSVNNATIDDEHKQLFDIAKEAFKIVDPKKRNTKLKEILTDLYDYMKTHFEHEELFMEKVNYPNIEEHKKLHKSIIESLNNFVKEIANLDVGIFEKELARLIDISLVQHIIQEDRKIMLWLQQANK